jgi:CO/xanthine dehydrogenase FAD-binding subunit
MASYLRPKSLEEAVSALGAAERIVLAGCTDYYPARVGRPLDDDVLDISGLTSLRGISQEKEYLRIGALTSWTDIASAALPSCFDGLRQAARTIGGRQIQNTGTIGGNLCNASPAADGLPNLLVLEALVELASDTGVRRLPVAEFVTGSRQTRRQTNEMVTGLLFPPLPDDTRSRFLKLGARAYLVISVAMVGVVLVPAAGGTIAEARVAVGACSPVATRLPALESELAGRPLDSELAVQDRHLEPLSPVDDIRGTRAYRRDAVLTLVRRALAEAAS